MTKQEYAWYEEAVKDFFVTEGITNLSTGLCHCPDCMVELDCQECPKCGKDAGEFPNEPFFSWSPCECCKTHMGGNREYATGYNDITKKVYNYTICEDCVVYTAYGRLDDMTMLEIEGDTTHG